MLAGNAPGNFFRDTGFKSHSVELLKVQSYCVSGQWLDFKGAGKGTPKGGFFSWNNDLAIDVSGEEQNN